jgi:hypothetical protein
MADIDYVWVRTGLDGRVQILNQDEEIVLDFLKDDIIANRIASGMNRGRKYGVSEDQHTVRA